TPALTFACLGCNSANPTTALNIVRDANGVVPSTAVCTLLTLTTDAPTTIDTGVTVASGGPVQMHVNGGSGSGAFFLNGALTVDAPADTGLGIGATVGVESFNGLLVLDGSSGNITVTGLRGTRTTTETINGVTLNPNTNIDPYIVFFTGNSQSV